jgi:hypothetical protein
MKSPGGIEKEKTQVCWNKRIATDRACRAAIQNIKQRYLRAFIHRSRLHHFSSGNMVVRNTQAG